MGVARIFADEDDGERKEQREDDADGIVVFNEVRFAEELDKRHRDNTHECRTEE